MSDILRFNTDDSVAPKAEQIKIFTLVKEDDPVLFKVLPEFDFSNPPVNPIEFASTLVETCKYHNGLGLSANQCGFEYRVFVMGAGNNYVAHFNPRVISESEELVHLNEGCLSYNHLFLNITRPSQIEVEYEDYNGQTKTATYTGLTARCFLHELDHMNGIVFKQRAKPMALKSGVDKRKKLYQRLRKANEKLAARLRPGLSQVN